MLAVAGSLVAAFWATLHLRTLLLAAVVFLFFADFLKSRRPRNYPPRPWRLPFIGNLVPVDFGQLQLSGIFLWSLFTFMNASDITSLLVRLFISNGHIWEEQRMFTLTVLRNFCLGKKSLEQHIQEGAQHIFEAIEKEQGQPFNPHFKLSNATSNIICSITFGERFEYHDGQFQEFLKLLNEVTSLEASVMCQFYSVLPWIIKFLPGTHQTFISNWGKHFSFHDFMIVSHSIEKHNRDLNPAETRDVTDAYLKEMAKYTNKTTTSFHEEDLICDTLDLLLPQTETASMTLHWGLLCMALYPEVQEKVQAEIDSVIGQWKQPSLADRESLPHANAVIHEVEVTIDTTLARYHLPKGTVVFINLAALHRDPKEWATPDNFNLEHFLENRQFKKRESFLPFSPSSLLLPVILACLGEQLAWCKLLIFFTSLLQKFTFKSPRNASPFLLSVTASVLSLGHDFFGEIDERRTRSKSTACAQKPTVPNQM
uniref:Cytochrome P450 2J2 n=1 Tax=Castor canadensis TaxID=51338 RepID=A0A8C0VWG8_CASCN